MATKRRGLTWGKKVGGAAATALALTATIGVLPSAQARPVAPMVDVIVRGGGQAAADRVAVVGGSVTHDLDIIDGFAASLPADRIAALHRVEGVLAVTPNGRVSLSGNGDDEGENDIAARYPGSMPIVNDIINANDAWATGAKGQGIDVAILDSGIAPVLGLHGQKVTFGPDLSFESQAPNLQHLDTYGHGTHLAGIIAGSDGPFSGVAPAARLVSLKLADASGATDVSQVLAALDWVVEHKNSNGLNIRVLNLSFGTDGTQDYLLDPLAYASEVAWRSGIVVVVAAGNNGARGLTNPGTDPLIISVGAVDTKGTTSASDDVVPDFSSRALTGRSVDLVAPGQSIISLRAPGSSIDQAVPSARIGERFFKGTGTSQSAAVVSGAAAVLLSARPTLTPDEVKAALMGDADPLRKTAVALQGRGTVDVMGAINLAKKVEGSTQNLVPSTGMGTLEGARGSHHLMVDGVELRGEVDIFGNSWSGNSWSGNSWSGNSWSGNSWSGNSWSGNSWSSLNGNSWSGNSWSVTVWPGNSWSGNSWSGNSWSGNSWSGNSWSGNSWSGNSWSGNSWSGALWQGNSWSITTWPGNSWSSNSWS